MTLYTIIFSKEAKKDIEKLSPKLKQKLKKILINTISKNPYQGKKLIGDLTGFYSFRLTLKDRIVYSVGETDKTVLIHRARTHYGD